MYFIPRNANFKLLCSISRCYSSVKKTHYEVLHLQRNCSDKEIKEAFIQLSKEYHPDKNKDVKAQEHFVRIVEAYNVLGKASSRASYDNIKEIELGDPQSEYVYKPHVPYNLRNNPKYNYYYEKRERPRSYKYNEPSDPPKKVPNYVIITLCVGIAVVGFVIQMMVIRQSFFTHQRYTDEKSILIAAELERVKSAALENGNEKQTRLLLEKIVQGSNSTIATANLGQALANERK